MNDSPTNILREPIGRFASRIGKFFFDTVKQELIHLDIDRSFYPLYLIGESNGKITQKELANKIHKDKAQVVRIIDYLSEKGYVERIQNPNDRRECLLYITVKGEKAMPDIVQVFSNLHEAAFKNIPENKVEELFATLGVIEKNLQDKCEQ